MPQICLECNSKAPSYGIKGKEPRAAWCIGCAKEVWIREKTEEKDKTTTNKICILCDEKEECLLFNIFKTEFII